MAIDLQTSEKDLYFACPYEQKAPHNVYPSLNARNLFLMIFSIPMWSNWLSFLEDGII